MSTGSVHEGLGDLVTAWEKKCNVAVTVPVLQQACWRHKMWKMKNSFFPCKSSLSSEFYAPSFGFIIAGLVTVSPLLTMPPRRKLSTFDKIRAIAWIQDGIAKAEVARRLGVHHSVIVRLTQRFRETNSIEEATVRSA